MQEQSWQSGTQIPSYILFPLGTKGLKSQNLSENSPYRIMNPLGYPKYGALESGLIKYVFFESQNITLTLLKVLVIIILLL